MTDTQTTPTVAATPVTAAPADVAASVPVDAVTLDPAMAGPDGLAGVNAGAIGWALDLLDAGGPVVAILAVLSVAALAIILVKLWQFAAARVGDRRTARRALALHRAGRSIEAIGLAARSRNPVAEVVAYAVRGNLRRDLTEAVVREEVARLASDRIDALRAYLRPLEVIAGVAPLLGLFGTVLGMIEAFKQLQQAGSQVNPAVLSGGIWEALLTTAVGLAVAIPVVAILAWMEGVVDRVTHEMESVVTQVFTRDLAIDHAANEHAPEPRHDLARLRPAAVMADR